MYLPKSGFLKLNSVLVLVIVFVFCCDVSRQRYKTVIIQFTIIVYIYVYICIIFIIPKKTNNPKKIFTYLPTHHKNVGSGMDKQYFYYSLIRYTYFFSDGVIKLSGW